MEFLVNDHYKGTHKENRWRVDSSSFLVDSPDDHRNGGEKGWQRKGRNHRIEMRGDGNCNKVRVRDIAYEYDVIEINTIKELLDFISQNGVNAMIDQESTHNMVTPVIEWKIVIDPCDQCR